MIDKLDVFVNKEVFMKKIMIMMGLAASLVSLSVASEMRPALQGRFKIEPKAMHEEAITGMMHLYFEVENIQGIHLDLDKPVFGNTAFDSREQAFNLAFIGEIPQIAVIYKLKKAPHKWYFVVIGNSVGG